MLSTESVMRSLHLALHRVRVGHGIPPFAAPLAQRITNWTHSRFSRRERERVCGEAEAVRRRFAGQTLTLHVSRAPEGFAGGGRKVQVTGAPIVGGVVCEAEECTAASLRAMSEHLVRHGLPALRGLSIARILAVLGEASELWLEPSYDKRALAIEAIHRRTGFSREMVIHSMDLEMRSSRKLDLWRTLWTELGNPKILDDKGWTLTGEAPAIAFGPSLLAGVFSSNIPALPHLTYMRGLAVKAPVLGKVATHEPIFAGLYIDTLRELCPEMAPALAAVWFRGGSQELEAAFLSRAEHVIAYGTERSLDALARSIPPNARRMFHGHRIGIGIVDRAAAAAPAPNDVAERMAYDFGTFDGQACLAPIVYFVEGGALADGVALAERVGRALDRLSTWLPRRSLGLQDRAARRSALERWSMLALFDEDAALVQPPAGNDWAVLVTRGAFSPQPSGDRLCHLHVVDRVEDALPQIAPYGHYLQNVAVAVEGEARRQSLVARVAKLGASRVTRPGLMPTPSMMWHHDGRLCLADLVRWADVA